MKEIKPEEIINTFLKANLDCIKDESLDIDLSACSTIPFASSYDANSDLLVLESNVHDLSEDCSRNETLKNRRKSTPPKKATLGANETNECTFNLGSIKNNDTKIEFKCGFCVMFFSVWDELLAHEQTHKISFKCNECGREFLNENGLKRHVRSHKTGTRKDAVMECPDCGKLLKLSSMSMHRKIHSDSKRFSCDICGQKFVQKINLIHHTKVHTGEKPFECPQCNKSFPERSHLVRHQRYHVPTRPYKCEKCGKMYKTERCLKVHNLVHLDQRPFVCGECNKSFISSSKLKQHSNIHTGERPYKCKYCSRDFTNFPNWLKHTRRRHKVDHKTGELLQNIPKYNSKQKKTEIEIKAEERLLEEKQTKVSEIHSLSITSPEEMIIEQYLKMEEAVRSDSCDTINNHLYNSAVYDLSPFSSPASDFQQYMPLPPIQMLTTNNFFNPNKPTLPSVETLFASSLQKTHSNF